MAKLKTTKTDKKTEAVEIPAEILEAQQDLADTVIQENSVEDMPEKDEEPATKFAVEGSDITKEELEELRKEHKKIYQTFFVDKLFVWHRMKRKTFTSVCEDTKDIKDEDEMVAEREKRFCEACVVYPRAKDLKEDIDDEMIRTKIAQEILFKSGFYRPVTVEV